MQWNVHNMYNNICSGAFHPLHFIFVPLSFHSVGLYDVHSVFGYFVSVTNQALTASASSATAAAAVAIADLISLAYFKHTSKLKLFPTRLVCVYKFACAH